MKNIVFDRWNDGAAARDEIVCANVCHLLLLMMVSLRHFISSHRNFFFLCLCCLRSTRCANKYGGGTSPAPCRHRCDQPNQIEIVTTFAIEWEYSISCCNQLKTKRKNALLFLSTRRYPNELDRASIGGKYANWYIDIDRRDQFI